MGDGLKRAAKMARLTQIPKLKPGTQTPWFMGMWDGDADCIEIWASKRTKIGADKISIAEIDRKKISDTDIANAEYICLAVNSHASLVKALSLAYDVMRGEAMSKRAIEDALRAAQAILRETM